MDLALLLSALQAGAVVAATATVEEVTKDAYNGLKSVLVRALGRRVERAAEKLEHDPTSVEGKAELSEALDTIHADDAPEITQKLTELLDALRADKAAQAAYENAQIALDLDVKGNILLQGIQNATGIGVKAKAGGDFSLKDVNMARKDGEGK